MKVNGTTRMVFEVGNHGVDGSLDGRGLRGAVLGIGKAVTGAPAPILQVMPFRNQERLDK